MFEIFKKQLVECHCSLRRVFVCKLIPDDIRLSFSVYAMFLLIFFQYRNLKTTLLAGKRLLAMLILDIFVEKER